MKLRWLMTLGELTDPEVPRYAEAPGPYDSRAAALVDDCAQLFPILLAWRKELGCALTGWAAQVEAETLDELPDEVVRNWSPLLRLDTMPGGYIKISDYRDHEEPHALGAGRAALRH
ncbi:hypothetical protein [Streptomyces sp. NPDC050145]|uniref:hypothetical protein n=1 Tax=Streptomyces sp. NPDC050145 TaxID=3365602 RepID=UPI00378E194F